MQAREGLVLCSARTSRRLIRIRRLRAGHTVKTVRVPEPLTDLFAKAEAVVAQFFRDRTDDPTHGRIEIHGERYLLIRGGGLSIEFFDLVRSLYGAERQTEADEFSRAILFDLAHSIGRTDAQNLQVKMQLNDPLAKLSAGPVHFAYTGWAFVELFPECKPAPGDEFFLVFEHPYSFESDAWVRARRTAEFPVCVMNAGYSSGWCEAAFDQRLVSAEILCRGKGDDTCRFIMAPPHRIEAQIATYLAANPGIASRAAGYRIPDFFARKREEEALKHRQDELERELRQTQKLEALGRLAGGIAHDFNNLISVVLGQAMLAQRRVSPSDPLSKDLTKIIRAGERAAALTQQLLAFGRSQVTRNEILDLNSVVEETARMIERVIGEDIELSLQLADNAGSVSGDRTQLEQVLMNLAVNARDAMPDGGRLTIATSVFGNGKVQLQVSDSGIGMSEETHQRAFEPFFTTKGDRGNGLGLSTVYGIVISAGGSIDVLSKPGQGCSVQIAFPRLEHSPDRARLAPASMAIGSGSVLVVDDKPDLCELATQALQSFGYQVMAACSGEEALPYLADTQLAIDLLLTDVVMPRMNGVDLAARAIELRPDLRVLYMSGHAPDPRHRALFANDGAFLQKPFTLELLGHKVAEILARPQILK
jgi:signal transduction histidine kinase/CheY-like chemotaxis protein